VVVDDEIHILHVLSHKLKHCGFTTASFQKPETALAALQEQVPDLMIIDFQMPCWSGLEFCQHIRHLCPHDFPIIMLTAQGLWLDEILLKKIGISRCIRKPFSPRKVVEAVQELLTASCV